MTSIFCPACFALIGQAAPWEADAIHQQHMRQCESAQMRRQFDAITKGLNL